MPPTSATRPPTETRPLGTAAAFAAVASWGFGPVLVKLVDLGGLTLALYRLWLGSAVMAVVCLATRRRIRLTDLRVSGRAGLLFGANVTMFFTALKHTSVADASLISSLSPVIILVVAGPWFGEQVTRRDVGWTVAALAGVVLVIVGSSSRPAWSLAGDLFAVGALVTWTAYFLATKRARVHLGTIEYQTGVMLGAAVLVTPVALATNPSLPGVPATDWIWLLLFVLVPGAGGHALMSWAHRYVDVSVSSLITVAQPVTASVAAAVILGESLGALQIMGGVVVLAAIAFVVGGRRGIDAAEQELAA